MKDKEFLIKFAENLKRIRKEKGLSQAKVSEALNISLDAYKSYEYAHSYPVLDRVPGLCKILEISSDQLLGMG